MKRRLSLILILALLLAACGPEGAERFASLSVQGQLAVSDGIVLARALRETGKVTPEKNLKLAQRARTVVVLHRSAMDLALNAGSDGLEPAPLVTQLDALLAEADALIREGTIEVDDDRKVIFDLTVMIGRNRLQGFADELKSKPGVLLVVSPKAKAKLAQARATAERNLKALDAAIEALTVRG